MSTAHQRSGGCEGFYLQADGQIDPAAEGRADRARVKAQVFEELGEGVRQGHPGTLLRHHNTGPDPGQVQTPSLEQSRTFNTAK